MPPERQDKAGVVGSTAAALHDAVTGPWGFVLFLTVMLAGFCVLRVLFPDGPSNADVGEQLWMAVDWRWSYGSGANPPLFTWLVNIVNVVTGSTAVSAEVVRFALLWLFCFLNAHTVRAATGDARLGALAGLAPLTVFAIGWAALFRHSNTMLLLVAVMMTLAALQRLDRRDDAVGYLFFALATAFGIYSKYNYLLVWAAFVAVALTDGRLRARLLDRRMIAALLLVVLLASPLLHWVVGHLDGMLGHGRMRLAEKPSYPALPGRLSALADLVVHTAGLLLPLFLILLALCPRAFWRLRDGDAELVRWRRLVERYLLVVLAALIVAILALGTTRFQARYIYVLVPVLPLAFLRLAAADLGRRRRHWLAAAMVVVILLVFAGAVFRGVTYASRHATAAPGPGSAAVATARR